MIQNKAKLFLSLFVSIVAWLIVYWQPLNNMVATWLSSETYKHCFFILPIVLYLIYEKRDELALIEISPAYWLVIPLLLGQIAYLFAELMGVNLFMELSAYGSLICLLWLILGTQMIKALMFPLFYLILAIPMGEELVPGLQSITADLSVFFVQLTGIPVYREGLYIYVSNGTFVVAEACAGIRFLIATIAVGFLYAYLFYRSFWRRVFFVLLCIAIPILANGFRAFGIVIIGHLSDMKHAVGFDHLVYGWFFFAFILLLLMAIGRFWREDYSESEATNSPSDGITATPSSFIKATSSVLIVVIALVVKPTYFHFIMSNSQNNLAQDNYYRTLEKQGYSLNNTPSWFPIFDDADKQYSSLVKEAYTSVEIYGAHFDYDNSERELINWNHQLFDKNRFSLISQKNISINLNDKTIDATVLEVVSMNGRRKYLVYWYTVDDTYSSNAMTIKLSQLLNKLKGGSGGGTLTMLAIDDGGGNISRIKAIIESLEWINR